MEIRCLGTMHEKWMEAEQSCSGGERKKASMSSLLYSMVLHQSPSVNFILWQFFKIIFFIFSTNPFSNKGTLKNTSVKTGTEFHFS